MSTQSWYNSWLNSYDADSCHTLVQRTGRSWQNRSDSDTTVDSDGDTTVWHNRSKWHDKLMVIRLVGLSLQTGDSHSSYTQLKPEIVHK